MRTTPIIEKIQKQTRVNGQRRMYRIDTITQEAINKLAKAQSIRPDEYLREIIEAYSDDQKVALAWFIKSVVIQDLLLLLDQD